MKKITTINTLLVFLVIIGTIIANLSTVVSIMPKSTTERDVVKVDNKTTITNANEFDIKTLTEIADYISIQAAQNDFEISAMVYSSGLLFESDNSLIIIGHGHFSSNNQYFIADYSENNIHEMANDKETVALLSCYSSNIKLVNERQLTYDTQIDLITVMNDLSTILQWEKTASFSPCKNIQLIDLDPGDSGNGGFNPNLAPRRLVNGVKSATSYSTIWNLNYESAAISLTNYMLGNIGIRVEFSFSTTFYEELSSGDWQLKYHTATYDAWSHIEGDMKTYIKITNIKIDAISKNDEISITVDELMVAISKDGKTGLLETMGQLAGIFAGVFVVFMTGYISCEIAIAVGAASLAGLSYLCACLAVLFVFLTIYLVIIRAILYITWI